MRALVQHGPEDLRVEERDTPAPGAGEVLVRVQANGLCGSDIHFWKHAVYGAGVILGHEIAGEVVALGEGVVDGPQPGDTGAVHAGIRCGECERCRDGLGYYCKAGRSLGTGGPFGGLGEYLVAPAQNFMAAPAGCDPALLTFSEPLANALRCLSFLDDEPARSAVILGGGPIGLSCLAAARHYGVERVLVVEGRERRRRAALELGAEDVIHPDTDEVWTRVRGAFAHGPDLVVEAVGLPLTIQNSFRLVRPRGAVVVMGVCMEGVELQTGTWMLKELTIRSSIGCDADDHRRALDLITTGKLDPAGLVTRRIALDEAPEALAMLAGGGDEIKVVVEHGRA